MQEHIEELHQICARHPFEEKILIVDSHSVGEQIYQSFLKNGYRSIHLKIKTVKDMTQDIIAIYGNPSFSLLEPVLGQHLIYYLLKELQESRSLTYFSGMEVTPSFSQSIYQMIEELRMAGYTSENLPAHAFISSEKAEDMRKIFIQFEQLIAVHHLQDLAGLYQQAIQVVRQTSNSIYILQSHLHLSDIELTFLKKILPEHYYKLPLPEVLGVSPPEHYNLRSINWGRPGPFSYLYKLDEAEDQADLSIFTAKTEETELKQILAQIKQQTLRLDSCILFYTRPEPYVTILYQLAEQHQLPVTFGEGLPLSLSRPGRLVRGLLQWMDERYSTRFFIHLLNEGLIALPENAPSNVRLINLLREAEIGWGPKRYKHQLDKLLKKYEYRQWYADSTNDKEAIQRKLQDIAWLKDWFDRLFKQLPPMESVIREKEFLTSFHFFLKNFANSVSAIDQSAQQAILETLNSIIPYAVEALPKYDLFEKLYNSLDSIRVRKSGPKPGYLHIDAYHRGIYHSRKHLFIVGADNRSFPGSSGQDPLLLDQERKKLSNNLELMKNKGEEHQYVMLQLLALSQGPVTISYCSFNMSENRSVNPSYLFLQCYRMVTGNHHAEFKELKDLPARVIPEQPFMDKDFWLLYMTKKEVYHPNQQLLDHYVNLQYGLQADYSRNTHAFTEYDGRIDIDTREYDPRLNSNRTVTAGKLEKLAGCSYAYFLEEILQVKPIEEQIYHSFAWLDPATRGTLLHRIFESFYQKQKEKKQKPSYALHKEDLHTIAWQLIEEQKQVQSPPNERVFQREVQDILEACDIFLKEEENFAIDHDALYFEYAFGIGEYEPAVITLPSKAKIHISGKIDRVDRGKDGNYHIIDYKTGSTYNYKDYERFKGGRQLQHFIYALAIEQHLKLESGAVKESSYFFPTSKGQGRRFSRKQDASQRENGLHLLETLTDVIKSGHFSMTDDPADCHFCQLKSVCRRSFYDPEILEAKQMDPDADGIRKFLGVRNYE
ncbi:PD-(D/E)XK nuclease family protein [Salinibacillus aidingensis]|uniref:PD-(D/E)XK nuclease family protein n=1 Tax=Salinibacillus aidingensis TaxID=237684 RepID=A0ABN1AN53_9BACI